MAGLLEAQGRPVTTPIIERLVRACEAYLALHGRRKGVSEGEAKAAYKELLEALAVARTVARG